MQAPYGMWIWPLSGNQEVSLQTRSVSVWAGKAAEQKGTGSSQALVPVPCPPSGKDPVLWRALGAGNGFEPETLD